jgi:hypothetical protein
MTSDDPKPQAPTPPEPGDCCHSGCAWCVDDIYQEELDRYREALKEWEDRQSGVSSANRTQAQLLRG